MTHRDPILWPEGLRALSDPIVFDARSGPDARARYGVGHLRHALFADLEADLADVPADAAQGGRHPLPDVQRFAVWLGQCGVTPARDVVIYDDQGGANAAARLWWMLRAIGHERVQVLDGGFAAALAAGLVLETTLQKPEAMPPYPTQGYHWPLADIDVVERARTSPTSTVIDVRAAARFRGEHEPIDPVAGHIPGAINVPLSENLDDQGNFHSAEALRALYEKASGDKSEVIVHCGSGVTACHTLLAFERAGLTVPKLYVGSWSEWCRRPERERARGA